ncbi:MAG: AEC family transporter [Candidatus Paceibacterota bacterium]|jgi:hypothetical protein
MIQILTIIAPLFVIIFVSALLQKFEKIKEGWSEVLNEFALKIGLPVLMFSTLTKVQFSFSTEGKMVIANSIFILISLGIGLIIGKILKLDKQMYRTLFICFVFGNIGYLGIPVLIQIAGEGIIPVASLITAIYLFWMFSVGIGYLDYLTGKDEKTVVKDIVKNIFLNPIIIAVILGIIIGSLQIKLPNILIKSLDMVNLAVTPIVLIVIGLFIGKSKLGKLTEWLPIFIFSFFTLMILPAGFYLVTKLLGYSSTQFSSSIIQAAMPLAITPFALADKYNLDKTFIARSIVLSTILSIISLPFWISLVT